jgi:hypothetical protein
VRPYSEYNNSDHFVREFSHDVDNEELVWHRDREDRLVEVLESDGWAFQYDNEFPFELLSGMMFRIDNHKYHRVIKNENSGKLLIKIYEGQLND